MIDLIIVLWKMAIPNAEMYSHRSNLVDDDNDAADVVVAFDSCRIPVRSGVNILLPRVQLDISDDIEIVVPVVSSPYGGSVPTTSYYDYENMDDNTTIGDEMCDDDDDDDDDTTTTCCCCCTDTCKITLSFLQDN
jgi:hypothetical protein